MLSARASCNSSPESLTVPGYSVRSGTRKVAVESFNTCTFAHATEVSTTDPRASPMDGNTVPAKIRSGLHPVPLFAGRLWTSVVALDTVYLREYI